MISRSSLVVLGLVLLAGVGLALVLTADDDGPQLVTATTADGVVVDIPRRWVVSDEFDFQYVPSGSESSLDLWSVAWVCPPSGCVTRSLEEWRVAASDLPTFTAARAEDGVALFDLEERGDDRSWVLTARTNNNLRVVHVAVFHDGEDRYLACNLVVQGDPGGLDDAIVDACRTAEVPT